jgi:hypothetical protein
MQRLIIAIELNNITTNIGTSTITRTFTSDN